ncbi:thioredoxin domain-containing protein [Oscillatoria sp. FACHB-1407]|uniref:DsbA family protein n=1 Tax=Oscillatoria sp. FACHB-1407 TaxID=2692847 RepID=UPI0016861831|nr:thioredoxin domain-containing protein [Oscillatoria sp. FACHB-1407]MBD2463524.1 thioredoxin domain-containing protein [Oscillatoria sp. FACHB-1407]
MNTNGRLVLPVSNRDHIQGSETACTTLVEYGDYQCYRSSEAHRVVRQLQQQFGDRLRFAFRHFPQSQVHDYAQHAAEAAEAAAAQGKFWEMHACLCEHYYALNDGHLVEYAMAINLNINQFLKEMTNDVHVERVQQDYQSGLQSGVMYTPTFFINNIQHQGAWDRMTLATAILAQL